MPNFDTDYKFNPKVREIIEARKGVKMGLTHAQSEFLVKDILDGKYKGNYKFNQEDKSKIMFSLVDFNPNKYDKQNLGELAKFLINSFDKKEIIDFVIKIIKKHYHPGMVIYNVRVFNSLITYFVSLFPDYFTMYKGIIINKKFIGDIKKIYSDVQFNENTAEIKDELVNDKIDEFINNLKSVYKRKIKVYKNDNIIIIYSNNESVINGLSTYNLNIEDIPEIYFKNK